MNTILGQYTVAQLVQCLLVGREMSMLGHVGRNGTNLKDADPLSFVHIEQDCIQTEADVLAFLTFECI